MEGYIDTLLRSDPSQSNGNATPAQVAIAWLIARPGLVAPVASAPSVAQLQDLIAATKLELSATDVALLDEASS